MSNIKNAFKNGKAFIPFVTCGDPDLETTEQIVYAMVEAGADLIELGIPFSDPTAEGPVIQGANIRALANHVTTNDVFDLVRKLRKTVTIPMVFMTYANVVFSYGSEKFISICKEIGIDGLILPDIPYEEKDEFDGICKKYDLDLVSMIAPTSHNRISMIAKEANGFNVLVRQFFYIDCIVSHGLIFLISLKSYICSLNTAVYLYMPADIVTMYTIYIFSRFLAGFSQIFNI